MFYSIGIVCNIFSSRIQSNYFARKKGDNTGDKKSLWKACIGDQFETCQEIFDLWQAALAIPFRVAILLEIGPSIPHPVVVCFAVLFGGASNINILFVSLDRFIAIK